MRNKIVGRESRSRFARASNTQEASVETQGITGLVRRDDTTVRVDPVGLWQTTWAADDRQLVVGADGLDSWTNPTRAYHTCMFAMTGEPSDPSIEALPGYPHMPMRLRESEYASYWGGSCLAVDGVVYQFLATSNVPYLKPDGSFWPDFCEAHSKLIYSPDNGATWHNQDGSTPVVWDNWDQRSAENMAFYDVQPEGAFASPVFLQMGKDYELNEDGYVYVYSTNGGEDGTANELVMYRVPRAHVLDRSAYEFFAGLDEEGSATWTKDITARSPVHTFPRGWVAGKMPGAIPAGWWTSVTFNPPLGLYMISASGTGQGSTGGWFGTPSYLGFWVGPTPWGPFTQVHEELAWTPENEPESRSFKPAIPPKWISEDGKSFWLIWSDYALKATANEPEEFNPDRDVVGELKGITDDLEFAQAFCAWNKERLLHLTFNMQRVDVIT
jgi:hypothetical protein